MWLYRQSTGELFQNNTHVSTGYAGAPGAVNDPKKQNIKNVGPLPCGLYNIDAPYNSTHTGPFTLSLIPDKFNEMFERDLFKMHGDTTPPGKASNGCIIQPRAVRERVWNSGDRKLAVVP